MSRRKKLVRFQQNIDADNVLEAGKDLLEVIKGKWNVEFFKNENPIVLEIGCGRGEYSVGLARVFPNKNFIGIDIKGERIAIGSQTSIAEGLYNVGFLRTQIQQIDKFFETNEVSEIWITFPDPRPRNSDERRRLTSPRFLEMYYKLLKPNGILHLKTDSEPLFDYSLETFVTNKFEIIAQTKDLHQSSLNKDHFEIFTKYEGIFSKLGFKINYLKAIKKE